MLSLGKLAPGQQQYYVDTVARGAEEYYTGAKEAPGQWFGAAARRLGLEGEVDAEALANLLEHVDPSGTYRLTAAHSVPTVAGFDVTFCCAEVGVACCSPSAQPEVSNEVRNAADAAVSASLSVLEQAACRVRRGKGGHTVLGRRRVRRRRLPAPHFAGRGPAPAHPRRRRQPGPRPAR